MASLLKTSEPRGKGQKSLQGQIVRKGALPRVAMKVVSALCLLLGRRREK